MGSPILDVKDLSISFSTSGAEVEAVKKISFSVRNGEALGYSWGVWLRKKC